MEEEFNDIHVNNEFLSQSYVQGISRITGRKEEDVSILHIPKEIILQRKEAWNKLFLKYSENVSDETELDIHTFEPIEEYNDSHESEYRLPMRKPSYLVQYWVDTGMPPCKALDENNHSEPGSSLSEYEQSTLSASNNLKATQCENIQAVIRCTSSSSSIDTAVYILSNANTTKKADTIAIMEGAKPCNAADVSDNAAIIIPQSETLIPIQQSTLQHQKLPSDIHSETTESLFPNSSSQHPGGSLENNKNTRSPLISDNEKENSFSDDTQSDNELNCSLTTAHFERLLKSPLFNNTFYNNTPQYSSNKSDILDISFQSTSAAYRAQNTNNLESDSSQESSQCVSVKKPVKKNRIRRLARVVDNTVSKALHRRKLYTGRNSPVDLITPVVKEVGKLSPIKEAVKARQSLHPALETPHSTQDKTLMIMKRAKMRARMKMKRASLLSSTLGDTSQESDPNMSLNSTVPNEESVSNATGPQEVTPAEQHDTTVPSCNLADTWKVLSANLNPVVRLQRIDVESWKKFMTSERRNTTTEDVNRMNKSMLTKQNLLDMEKQIRSTNDVIMYSITNCSYVEIADSDQSTIIMCRCTDNSVRSKVLSDSHCNDNFDTLDYCSDTSKNLISEDVQCENNNNSTAPDDSLKLKVSIEALNKRTEYHIDQEAIDDAEVSEIMKKSETRNRVVPSSELRKSEPQKISESSVKLLPRKSVNLQSGSTKNWRSNMNPVNDVCKRVLRSANEPMKSKSSKPKISMNLRTRSQEQIERMREYDEISYTSSSISDCINEIESNDDPKREAIANAEKLVIRLERLPSNILANKYRKYENSDKKRKVFEVKEMPRKSPKVSEPLKVVKFTKKFFSNFRNNALDNSLSCSEESSIIGVTKEIETANIDVIKNGKTVINNNFSQNSSTALVTIGTSVKNVCMSSGDCSANWLPSDLTSSADEDDDIFNVKSTEKGGERKSMRNILNISDTSSTNSSRRITRSSAFSFKESSNGKKKSSEVHNKMKKTKRNGICSSSEVLSKESRKETDSSRRAKSREILTVNDIIYKPNRITRNRSKTLSVLCTETGWKNRKMQRVTRNRLCESEENMSESSNDDTLQKRGRSVRSRKQRLTNSLMSSDTSAVSSVKKKTSPLVRSNQRSNFKKLPKEPCDETSTTSNSTLISTRSKRLIRENGLRSENVKSTSSKGSKTPLLKKVKHAPHYTAVPSAPLDFTSDSTEGIVVNQTSIGSIRKKRKLENNILDKSILPKNSYKGTASLSKFREKFSNNISDASSSSSDANGRYKKLLSRTRSKSTESKDNSQTNATVEKLTNETTSTKSNVSLLEYLNNTSDESLISFSSTRGDFEKSKKISITKDSMRETLGQKSSEFEEPVVYQAITFHEHSDSDEI